MHTEIELKLCLPPQSVAELKSLPLLQGYSISEPTTQKLYTIYYDTPDFALKNERIALRLRKIQNEWVQTIKGGGTVSAGLHQRQEWEYPVLDNQPDFSKITDPSLIELFADKNLRQQLRSIFVTDFTRITFQLLFMERCNIEFCIDQGEITAGQRTHPICEIELELKSGTPSQLLKFTTLLENQCTFPLTRENINKSMRGYALYTKNNATTK